MASSLINPVEGSPFGVTIIAPSSTSTLARPDSHVLARTAAAVCTVLAPANPDDGDCFAVEDDSGNAAANNITVNGNGKNIDGAATVALDVNGIVGTFVYDSGQWRRVACQRDYAQVPPPAQFSRSTELGLAASTPYVPPDPFVVANLDVTNDATVGNDLGVVRDLAVGRNVDVVGDVDADNFTALGDVAAGGDVTADNVIASVSVVGPFFTVEANPALRPATGIIRLPEVDGPVITGLVSAADYDALYFFATTSRYAFGSGSLYTDINGYAVAMTGGRGCSAYDGRNGITTDLTRYEAFTAANTDTTSTTRVNTPFTFAIDANEDWVVEADIPIQSSGGTGVRFAWDVPAGCTGKSVLFGCSSGSTAYTQTVDTTMNALIPVTFSNAAAAERTMRITAVFRNGATPGNVTLQFATVTSGTARIGALAKFSARRSVAV